VIVRAVTLEVSPEQAEELVKAREEGSIQLTLRNPLEDEPVVADEPEPEPEPEPVVEEPARPAPRRVSVPPTRQFDVTIIRGTSVSEQKASS